MLNNRVGIWNSETQSLKPVWPTIKNGHKFENESW